jgi:hypothetical protein
MVNFDCLTPLEEQPEPPNILALTTALVQRWPMTNLLDILKETELRVRFTEAGIGLLSLKGNDCPVFAAAGLLWRLLSALDEPLARRLAVMRAALIVIANALCLLRT